MKTYQTIKGQSYIVTSIAECDIKGYLEDNTEYLLLTVPANSQGVFVAISNKTTLSDTNSLIIPFADATRAHLELNPSCVGGGDIEGDYLTFNSNGLVTGGRLDELANGTNFQYGQKITSWDIALPSLTNGQSMFQNCKSLTSWTINLPSLTDAQSMFNSCTSLTSFTGDLPLLMYAQSMFSGCTKLTSWTINLPSLMYQTAMFNGCTKLTSFTGDLSSLTDGQSMFSGCKILTSFTGDLSSLTSGQSMFNNCKLNKASAIRILNSLPTHTSGTHNLTMGVHVDYKTDEEVAAAITAAQAKGWTLALQWNGTAGTSGN